jgi:hypothetical protein
VIGPLGIEHIPTIIDMPRTLVDLDDVDPVLQQTRQNFAMQGNFYRKPARRRARWTTGHVRRGGADGRRSAVRSRRADRAAGARAGPCAKLTALLERALDPVRS